MGKMGDSSVLGGMCCMRVTWVCSEMVMLVIVKNGNVGLWMEW